MVRVRVPHFLRIAGFRSVQVPPAVRNGPVYLLVRVSEPRESLACGVPAAPVRVRSGLGIKMTNGWTQDAIITKLDCG